MVRGPLHLPQAEWLQLGPACLRHRAKQAGNGYRLFRPSCPYRAESSVPSPKNRPDRQSSVPHPALQVPCRADHTQQVGQRHTARPDQLAATAAGRWRCDGQLDELSGLTVGVWVSATTDYNPGPAQINRATSNNCSPRSTMAASSHCCRVVKLRLSWRLEWSNRACRFCS